VLAHGLSLLVWAAAPQEARPAAPAEVVSTERQSARRSLLVVTLDTTRRDFMGFMGRTPSPTPCLDRLAAESVAFEDAYTVAPLTVPAHGSLFTGLYPRSHGVRENASFRLPQSARTLAEILAEHGYATAATVAIFVLDPRVGLDQGFEVYDAPEVAEGAAPIVERRADAMVARAQELLDRFEDDAPFFLWVHFFDPHFPYAPPPAFLPPITTTDPHELARLRYEGEVRFTDSQVGRLLPLAQRKAGERGLVVVVAGDHGESLGDAPESSHGYFLFDPTVRIPLLIRAPDLESRRVAAPVTLADLAPTLLSLLGIQAGEISFDGADLAPALRDPQAEPPDRALLLEGWYGWLQHRWAPIDGCVLGPLKYLRSVRERLFAPGPDATSRDESRSVFDPADPRSRAAAAALRRLLEAARPLDRDPLTLSGEDLEELLRLGYSAAGGGEEPEDSSALPDPHDRTEVIFELEKLNAARNSGDAGARIEVLRRLLEREPESAALQDELGDVLSSLGPENFAEAEQRFETALRLDPRRAGAHFRLGRFHEQRAAALRQELRGLREQGGPRDRIRSLAAEERERTRKAIASTRACLEFDPRFPEALGGLARLLVEEAERSARAGRHKQAVAQLREAEELGSRWLSIVAPDHPDRSRVAANLELIARRRAELESGTR
jgi:tetratricopeptide (TPR) repeat protein